jgi:hypothetical protein
MSDETATSSPIKASWLIGVALAFAIFAAIAGYSSRMTHDYLDYDQQQAQIRYGKLAKYRTDTTQTLTTAAWVDQTKGTVRIPIEEAMTREVDTLKATTAAMGQEIPGTKPAPKPASAAPTTNAAPSTNAASPPTPPAKTNP